MPEQNSPLQQKRKEQNKVHKLILYNDDVNTFDHVIDMLMIYCEHSEQQAEQCAWITHLKGKCVVKKGDYALIKQIAVALIEEGLLVEIQ